MTKTNKLARSALMISIFTLISKFLGFIREVLIAYKYGSGYYTDTYFVAMTATVLIMTSLGACLNTSLIPIFTDIQAKKGRKGKLEFLNNVLNLVLLITVLLAVLAYFFSPYIVKILAKGFSGEQLDLAVKLNRIGLPIVVFLGFTYVFSGYLHSSNVFGPPAMMGLPYNFVFIVFLLAFADGENIEGLMLASVIASSTQFLIQYPAIRHQGHRYKPGIDFKDPNLKKAMLLVLPVVLGSAVQQINTIIDKTLASDLAEGSISALTYASRINDMVIAVFVMAITTVVFPMLSKAFSYDEDEKIKEILAKGVNIILLVTVPATIGILILSEPIVRLFFQRGQFDSTATLMTSGALFFYSIGLVGASLRLMLSKVFYSFQDTKTPMINGIYAVVINVFLNYLLVGKMGHKGLALATSISSLLTSFILFVKLRKKLGPIGLRAYLNTFFKTMFSSLIMGLVVYLVYNKGIGILPKREVFDLAIFSLSILLGILVYFVLCLALGIEELRDIVGEFARRKNK